jgi:hypothetical protein
VARQVVADQALRNVIAVALGSVNKCNAFFGGCVEDGIDFPLRERASPFPAELPAAHANYRDLESCFAERSVFHGFDCWFGDPELSTGAGF